MNKPISQYVRWKRLHLDATLPFRAHITDAGFDLAACLMSETGRPSKKLISSNSTVRIPTGWAIRPPDGYVTLVLSRSGLASATPTLFVANSPGLIDPDYTGEIQILLYNGGFTPAYIEHGQRIAQVIFIRTLSPPFMEVDELPVTERGGAGFGSTGL